MSTETVLGRLAEFSPTDTTPRMIDSVFGVLPGAPQLPPYPALPSVVAALGRSDVAGATVHLSDPEVLDILWMSGLVDTADRGYAVFTGISSALGLFFGKGSASLETDTQQRNDAVIKAFALAYLAWKSSSGSMVERATAFTQLPAGRALLTYYAAIEVALPFADNAMTSTGAIFSDLMDKHGAAQLNKFSSLVGGRGTEGVQGALAALTQPIEKAIVGARPYVNQVAAAAQKYVPTALNVTDKAAGLLAGAADVMPVYRYLGARLAAESAATRA